jgi:hypothetical protein
MDETKAQDAGQISGGANCGHVRMTIAIPTVNRAYCIRRAVDSALAQTAGEIEVLVSNNGSTDETRSILDSYSDPRLRVFHRETTISPADHANFVLDQVRGELFVGLSDDDYLEPQFAERVIALFDQHPEMSFCYTRCWVHVNDAALPSPAGPDLEDALSLFQGLFAGYRHLFWCATASRIADIRRLGGLPRHTNMGDMYLWGALAFNGPVGCVGELLSHYSYLTGDNLSLGIPPHAWAKEAQDLFEKIISRLEPARVPASALLELRVAMHKFVARTTANQFSLLAARGASKLMLWRELRQCMRYLAAEPVIGIVRVTAALVLPALVLKPLLTQFVVRRSRWARPPVEPEGRADQAHRQQS